MPQKRSSCCASIITEQKANTQPKCVRVQRQQRRDLDNGNQFLYEHRQDTYLNTHAKQR